MLNRHPYLTHRALRFYLGATILATMSNTLGIVIDAIIVGRLLGPEALSAINLCTPLLQLLFTLMMLLNAGNAQMMSFAMGRGEWGEASHYFNIGMWLNLMVGLAVMGVGLFASHEVALFLCPRPELLPLIEEYARVMLISAPLYLLMPGLALYVRACSAPKLVMVGLVACNVVNLGLDLLFIRGFGWGVMGSSLATSCGYLVGVTIIASYLFRRDTLIRLRSPFATTWRIQGIMIGLPLALTSSLMTLRLWGVNHLIGDNHGAFGIAVLSVSMSLLMLVSMFIGGTSQSIIPSGSMMWGERDYTGFRMLIRRSFTLITLTVGSCSVAFLLFPEWILQLYGVEYSDQIAEATQIVRIIVLSYLPYGLNYLTMVIFQVTQQSRIALYLSVAQPMMGLVLMAGLTLFAAPDVLLWWSFVGGELIVMLSLWLIIAVVKRHRSAVQGLFMTPRQDDNTLLDLSLNSYQPKEQLEAALTQATSTLATHQIEADTSERTLASIHEALSNILQHAYSTKRHRYIDLSLRREGTQLRLSIKDDGLPFDPTHHTALPDHGLGKLRASCDTLEYKYLSGMNILLATFNEQ